MKQQLNPNSVALNNKKVDTNTPNPESNSDTKWCETLEIANKNSST